LYIFQLFTFAIFISSLTSLSFNSLLSFFTFSISLDISSYLNISNPLLSNFLKSVNGMFNSIDAIFSFILLNILLFLNCIYPQINDKNTPKPIMYTFIILFFLLLLNPLYIVLLLFIS